MPLLILYFLWEIVPIGFRHDLTPEPAPLPGEELVVFGIKCSWRMQTPIGTTPHAP